MSDGCFRISLDVGWHHSSCSSRPNHPCFL